VPNSWSVIKQTLSGFLLNEHLRLTDPDQAKVSSCNHVNESKQAALQASKVKKATQLKRD
jgi:Tfp pilus assembly protein PilN